MIPIMASDVGYDTIVHVIQLYQLVVNKYNTPYYFYPYFQKKKKNRINKNKN